VNISATVLKTGARKPFSVALIKRRIVVDSSSLDPMDTDANNQYIIPAGTPMAPVTGNDGRYMPIKRATVVSCTWDNPNTEIVVDDASPFKDGDVVRQWDADDAYADNAVGTLADVDLTTNTLSIVGDVTGDIAEDDLIGVAYNTADVVLLEQDAAVRDQDLNLVHVPASGVTCGQIRCADVNMPSGADPVLYRDMLLMDFVPGEPGSGDPDVRRVIWQPYIYPLSYRADGDITATIASKAIGLGHDDGVITKAGFYLGNTGADADDPLAMEGDVLIGGVSLFDVKPALTKAAADGATTFVAGAGVTVGVIDTAADDVEANDLITFVGTLTRTTPQDEMADLLVVVEIEYAA
jgi:hypothetical protein